MPSRRIKPPNRPTALVPAPALPWLLAGGLLLALSLLWAWPARSADWMPTIEEERGPAAQQPTRPQAQPEPDPLAPIVERPAPGQAAAEAPVKAMRVPVLVPYSALNKDLRAIGKGKGIEFKSKCNLLSIFKPALGPGGAPGMVKLSCPLKLVLGGLQGGACQTLKDWSGLMDAVFSLSFDPARMRLGFKAQGLALKDVQGRNAPKDIKSAVIDFLSVISLKLLSGLSLKQYVSLPGRMMPELFTEDAGDWLNDLAKPAGWRITAVKALRAGLELGLVVNAAPKAKSASAGRPLSDRELLGLWSGWESWDNYLVGVCKEVGQAKLNRNQRNRLLTALLDNRYAMASGRRQKALAPQAVRQQMESSWDEIKPVVAQVTAQAGGAKAQSLTKIMAAGEALTGALQQNPGLAAKIKPGGLNELFGPEPKKAAAGDGTDPSLRDALGLPPAPPAEDWDLSGEPPEVDGWPLPTQPKKGKKAPKAKKPPRSATGAPVKQSEWVPDMKRPKAYVAKVRELVAQTADGVLKKGGKAAKYRKLFQEIAAATAWQESCWIHYVRKKDGRIAILGSYDHKSAGLMQINFQVWKGIYNTDLLRKSIRYNALAGCEILKLYMERYALRKMNPQKPLPPDLLARSVYSMYNGGPSQFKGFFRRLKNHKLWQSEKLWNQKFERVKAGQWNKIKQCMPATARWAD